MIPKGFSQPNSLFIVNLHTKLMGLKSHPHVTGLDWELPLDLPNLKMDGFPNSESPNLQGAIFRRTTDVKRWGWVTNPNVKYMAITVPKRFFVNTWLTNKPIAWIYMAKIPVPHLLVYPACRSFQKKPYPSSKSVILPQQFP